MIDEEIETSSVDTSYLGLSVSTITISKLSLLLMQAEIKPQYCHALVLIFIEISFYLPKNTQTH